MVDEKIKIEVSVEEAKKIKLCELRAIAKDVYEKFKLQWIILHGYTLNDLLVRLDDEWFDIMDGVWLNNDGIENETCPSKIMESFEEKGFNGEIYPSYAEFLTNEFMDRKQMRLLMSKEQYENYKECIRICYGLQSISIEGEC